MILWNFWTAEVSIGPTNQQTKKSNRMETLRTLMTLQALPLPQSEPIEQTHARWPEMKAV